MVGEAHFEELWESEVPLTSVKRSQHEEGERRARIL
jgi:hypothetical protein